MSENAILQNLTQPPKAGEHELYRWCDYIELRCLTHVDKRFSRDALSEAMEENKDTRAAEATDIGEHDFEPEDEPEVFEAPLADKDERFSALCFRHLRWRREAFADAWPFRIDEHAQEIKLRTPLTSMHLLYLQFLLSSSLSYCPQKRWRDLTGRFERVSLEIFRHLMPKGSEVHAFGAAENQRYKGHLFARLQQLTRDVRGSLLVKQHHFAKNDSGDGGLDLVAWHHLGDDREGIPVAFAQCGCTATGWPNKMLEASPARLGGNLNTRHKWATYYFMPLDLSDQQDGKMDWQMLSDIGETIVIDRLRLIRLVDAFGLFGADLTAIVPVTEASAMRLT